MVYSVLEIKDVYNSTCRPQTPFAGWSEMATIALSLGSLVVLILGSLYKNYIVKVLLFFIPQACFGNQATFRKNNYIYCSQKSLLCIMHIAKKVS